MPVPKVPPFEVNVFLRFRYSRQCRLCCFSRARPANYQLDIELNRPVGQRGDIQNVEDLYNPVGFIVDGRLYTDDEPYWECLLEDRKIYDVAYLKQPFDLSIERLNDFIFRIPRFPAELVPAPDPRNSTSTRRALLIEQGLIPADETRGYRRTLSDEADREYSAWTILIIPRGSRRYAERMRRIVPNVPEVDHDALMEFGVQ